MSVPQLHTASESVLEQQVGEYIHQWQFIIVDNCPAYDYVA